MNAPLATARVLPSGERPPGRARSIADLAPADWRPPHLFSSREYLLAMEEAFGARTRFDYALWRTPRGVAGGAAFQTFDLCVPEHLPLLGHGFPGSTGLAPHWRPVVGALLARLNLRVVLCGSFFACGPHGAWRAPGQPDDDFRAWLARAARQVARDVAEPGTRVVLILKDLGACAADAPDDSFESIGEDPVMALDLQPQWRSLEDYAGALRAGYRRELRRVRERGAQVERRELSAADILGAARRIDELHAEVLARARVVPARKSARLFARLKELLGPRFSFVGYSWRGRLVAFNTRFLCGDELDSHYFGVDRTVSEELGLYKNLLYDDVGDAIALGCRRVSFGRDAQEVKSGLGAQPLPYTSFIRHDSRTTTALLAATARRFGPVTWAPRHPFRERGGTTTG